MRSGIWMLIVVAAACLTGCGEKKIDGSSEAAAKSSIEHISSKLDSDKKATFQESVQILAFQDFDLAAVMSGSKSPEDVAAGMFKALDGKTADQVIAEAAVIKAEREAREREQALAEIAELRAKAQASEIAKAELAKFKVHRSRFYISEGDWSYERKPKIELDVENGTGHAVSRAYFKGTISSPGRSIPWLVETFNYSISGGIEPGERAEWFLAPNQFGKWGQVAAPADALFTVEVERLDGADGEPLYDARGLTDRQAERMRELVKRYQ